MSLRMTLVSLLFIGTVVLHVSIAKLPLPVDVATTGKFSPATAHLGREALVIESPAAPENALLSHDGNQNELVDVAFEKASLAPITLQQLKSVGLAPPSNPASIDYKAFDTEGSDKGEPCRTFIVVQWAFPPQPSAQLQFFQLGDPGADRYRHFEMKAVGGGLRVKLTTSPPVDNPKALGCVKWLDVGRWESKVGDIPVEIVVAEGSGVRFRFQPVSARGRRLWDGANGLFEPFVLGVKKVKPGDPPSFQARAVGVALFKGGDVYPTSFYRRAHSPQGKPLLGIENLKVGSDNLQVSVAGTGIVESVDRSAFTNLLDHARHKPLLGVLLGALDVALIGLLFGAFFRKGMALTRAEMASLLDWAGAPNTTLALVFTDIVGSTDLTNELGDAAMRDVRHAHFQQARRLIQRHGGYEIKTIGDAFMVAFRRATDGLRFSLELRGGTGHKLVKVRAGVHVGPVDIEEQDAFGAMVNYAARVIGAAKGAEVWVSQQAKEDVLQEKSPELAQLQWMEHPDCELKGFKGRYVLWSIALPEP